MTDMATRREVLRELESPGVTLPWRARREHGPADPSTHCLLNREHTSLCSEASLLAALSSGSRRHLARGVPALPILIFSVPWPHSALVTSSHGGRSPEHHFGSPFFSVWMHVSLAPLGAFIFFFFSTSGGGYGSVLFYSLSHCQFSLDQMGGKRWLSSPLHSRLRRGPMGVRAVPVSELLNCHKKEAFVTGNMALGSETETDCARKQTTKKNGSTTEFFGTSVISLSLVLKRQISFL